MAEQTKQDLKELSTALLALDDMLISCMRCGFCMSVCPVYGVTMREADVTRGKITLLENLARHMIDDPEAVNEKLNRCLLCGSCQSNCPSGVKIMDIFLRARSIVARYLGLTPVQKLIFRGMLVRPKLFNALLDLSGKFQKLFIKDASRVVGTSCAPLFAGIIGDRHFPALAKKSFHSKMPSLDTAPGVSGLRVAFFPGCVSDKIFPGVPEAVLRIMEHHGVGVFMPADQSCCGIPALASGDRQTYDRLVRDNLRLFAQGGFDYFLTPCATCSATIKEIWPKLMEGYSPAEQMRIRDLQDQVMDVSQFLVDVLNVSLPERAEGGKRVTYHDSCHLKKSLGVAAQPRAILKGLPGYAFVEMPEADRCCGSGGSFTLYHYGLSKEIGKRKRDNIVSVSPDLVAAGCPACMMQIMDSLSRNNDDIPVRHVAELYAETLK
ncbi:MAG: (Fe-S)-binding protein [Desulfovibrio sp.]|jgi:glycolate oxidase iron-sulfur subunit|nr:(Fe-S)-binding protein [Desulfovibrio sp.]